jgi:hypothetical protein
VDSPGTFHVFPNESSRGGHQFPRLQHPGSSTGNTAEVNHTQMGLNQLMTHYLMALQERSVVQDESKLYLEHLPLV